MRSSGVGININNLIINILAFADDIAIMADSEENLQQLLNIVSNWCSKWRFIINPVKSKIMHFRKKGPHSDFSFVLPITNQKLEYATEYKYLGIIFDEHLTFKTAIEH